MRIVAGKFRRRKLLTSPGEVTRPITDRVKVMLFERLGDALEGARVADVFAGTGTMGLEALSRGAHSTVFIELDRRAFELLKRNVETLGVEQETLCWKTDVRRTSFRPKGVDDFLPYDLVFFDPPYRMIEDVAEGSVIYQSLERLARDGITAESALMLLRTPERAEFQCPPVWHFEQKLTMSTMEIHLFRKQGASS